MKDLQRRLDKPERERHARNRADAIHCEPRRWALLNLFVRSAGNANPNPWRVALKTLPRLDVDPMRRAPYSDTERKAGVLALLCREARGSEPYRDLLGLALKAGFANERQARWIAEQGLAGRSGGQP